LGWYFDWGYDAAPAHPGGSQFVQLIWTQEGGFVQNGLAQAIAANKGALWIIGNEPDNRWQGNSTPQQYATVYHTAYQYIKSRDPTATIAIAAVTCPTPLRLKWLDQVLATYKQLYGVALPLDVLNTHMWPLQELRDDWGMDIPVGLNDYSGMLYSVASSGDVALFKSLIQDYRAWAYGQGYGDKPMIITEMGILMPSSYGFPPATVNAYMDATFEFLNTATNRTYGYSADGYRLVQRWAWFSLNAYDINGTLYSYGSLTETGRHFRDRWIY
jgi:hypothetical protein